MANDETKLEEYLEQIAVDAYRYELDQEENIIRSLPFFIAALGLVATALGLLHGSFPFALCSAYGAFVYGSGAIVLLCVTVTFWFLWQAARSRQYKYISREDEILKYAAQLAEHHRSSPQGAKSIEHAVISDIRLSLIDQYCRATINNRQIHWSRAVARSRAVIALGCSLLVTFILMAAILLHDAVSR